MNFKVRNLINQWVSVEPLFKIFNFLKNIFLNRKSHFEVGEVDKFHSNNIKRFNATTALEIGAGRDLFQNLYLSNLLKKQYLFDIDELFSLEAVKKIAKFLNTEHNYNLYEINTFEDLAKNNIFYEAPCDILDVTEIKGLDIFLSTSVLEHIPENALRPILHKIKEMLKTGGILSLHIDYSDHLSHKDPKIHRNNFLQFSDQEWAKYNSRVCYQNRLRHAHYKEIFLELGFKVISEEAKNYDIPPDHINKNLLTGCKTDLATTGRWILQT